MLLVALTFIVLLLLNVPIAFTFGISGLMYFLVQTSIPLPVVVQRPVTGTQSFPLHCRYDPGDRYGLSHYASDSCYCDPQGI